MQVCVEQCPNYNWMAAGAQVAAALSSAAESQERAKMICVYGVNAVNDSRSIQQLVNAGLCASYILASENGTFHYYSH